MRRIVTMVVVIGMLAGACSGDDSADTTVSTDDPASTAAPSDTTRPDATEESASTSTDDTGETSADDTADGDTSGESTSGEPPDDTTDEPSAESPGDDQVTDENGSASGPTIESIDDIPEQCRDLLADFLREIEPVVSPIDWQTATMSEFEQVGADFETFADEFDAASEEAGCNDLDFVGDSEIDLIVEIAEDVAPGAVGFLEFITIAQRQVTAEVSEGDGDTAGADAIDDCDEAVDFVQGLVDDYDSVAEVPASDLLRFQTLATVLTTCSPEQLEFFDSAEVTDFFGNP